MKKEDIIAIIFVVVIVIALHVVIFQYNMTEDTVTTNYVKPDCLIEYAEDYCNGDVVVYDNHFRCVLNHDIRNGTKELLRQHFYLPEEVRSCTILQLNIRETGR